MDSEIKTTTQAGAEVSAGTNEASRCLLIAQSGVQTSQQFAGLMSALMSDLIEGKITPGVGNAVCNAGGKLLKIVELQAKYGQAGSGTDRVLKLTS